MEACIEALFKIEGEDGKRKTVEMIRVLKGAISVSKSRTGEVIYHYNRHEKKALRRQLAKYDRDTRRSRLDIEHQKRDILRKWSLVFGRQRNFCESIRVFDEMLTEAMILREKLQALPRDDTDSEDENQEPELTEEEKVRQEQEERRKLLAAVEDPRKRRMLLAKLNAPTSSSAAPAPTTGMLPKINMGAGLLFNGRIESEEEEKARLEREAEEERKRKAKELPRFDRELVKDFLQEQKHMHEDLLTRNALMKIKSQADHDHVFFKYRMKTKLPGSAQTLLHQLETDRPVEPESRSQTRQSARSELAVRPVTRGDSVLTRHSSRSMPRLPTRQAGRQPAKVPHSTDTGSKAAWCEADTDTEVPFTARCTHTAQAQAQPKLERAKTVHFS